MQTKQFEIALSTFEKIQAAFPALSMKLDLHHAHVDHAKGAIALHCAKIVQKRAFKRAPGDLTLPDPVTGNLRPCEI